MRLGGSVENMERTLDRLLIFRMTLEQKKALFALWMSGLNGMRNPIHGRIAGNAHEIPELHDDGDLDSKEETKILCGVGDVSSITGAFSSPTVRTHYGG